MEIVIMVLMGILFAAQMVLAIKQIKKGAPDGKILLIINIATLIIWSPLCVFKLLYGFTGIKIAWFVVAVLYMVYTIWYTNMLSRDLKR